MENRTKKNNVYWIIVIIMLIVMIAVNMYFGSMKNGFHMDELLTYGLSNNYYAPFPFKFGEWLSSSYYNEYLTVGPNDAFAYGSVFYNQAADVHPPVYYIVIHTISSVFQDSFKKWIGIGANLLFYVLTLITLLEYLNYLLRDKWVSLILTSFWGLSIGAISSVMYIRMYVLLTLWFVLFLFVASKLLNDKEIGWQLYLSIFAVTLGGVLTQYYFLIGAFFISAVLCLFLMIQKRWKNFLHFSLTMAGALLTALLIFPAIQTHLFETARGNEAAENMLGGTNYFSEYMNIVDRSIFARQGKLFVIVVLLLLITSIVIAKFKNRTKYLDLKYLFSNVTLIILPALMYIGVIQRIAPYRTSRYIFSVFPALAVGAYFGLYFALKLIIKNNMVVRLVVLFSAAFITFTSLQKESVEYLYPEYENILNIVEEYKGNDALVIHDAKWKITGNILELKEFENVLPLELDPNAIVLPDDEKIQNEDQLIVFINKVFDQEKMKKLLMEKYGFNEAKEIYDHNHTLVYLFK